MALTPELSNADQQRPEPGEREKALVKDFKRRIEAVEKLYEDKFKQYERNRAYVNGLVHDDGAPGLVRTNLVFSTLAALLPQTYAKDPDISVSPSEAVDPQQYKLVKQFGKTCESILSRKFVKEPKLKKRAKATARAAMTCEVGWVKLTYQQDIQKDPVIQSRIEDAQENLKRIQALEQKLDDSQEVNTEDLTKAKLEAELRALEENVEVVIERGLVIDKLLSESVLVLDPTVRDFDEYPRASALAQVLWFNEDQYLEKFGYRPSAKATVFRTAVAGKNPKSTDIQSSVTDDVTTKFYCCYEIWDKRTNTVYTWCKGEEGWCRPAFRPQKMGRRWYPFFALAFNPIDGQFYPMSDVQLLIELQDEYNTTRTNFAEHRRKHLPVRVVRKGGSLTPEDVDKIVNAHSNEVVVVNGAAGGKLSDDMAVLEHPPIDPQVYDTTPIRADIEEVSGASDAVRGSVLKAKTATEAEIMREGLMSRTAERQDSIEDWLQDMAEYSLQIFLQELPIEEVTSIAGPRAVWPELSRDEIFDLVNIEVKAGSTGKPNKMREREQWIELVPVIEQTMTKVMELRAMGQVDMADAMVELTRETLRRFDERIDVDSFMPPAQMGGGGMEQAVAQVPQMQAQLQQATQYIQQLQEQLTAAQQESQQATHTARKNELATANKERDLEFQRQTAAEERAHALALEDRKAQQAERMFQLQTEAEDRRAEQQRQHELKREGVREFSGGVGMEIERRAQVEATMMQTLQGIAQSEANLAATMQGVQASLQGLAAMIEQMMTRNPAMAGRRPVFGPDGRIKAIEVEGFGTMPVHRDATGRVQHIGGIQ